MVYDFLPCQPLLTNASAVLTLVCNEIVTPVVCFLLEYSLECTVGLKIKNN